MIRPTGPASGRGALRAPEPARSGSEWDAFVRTDPHGSFCHLWGWRSVFEGGFGHPCDFRVVRAEGGEIEGVLPLVRVRSALFGDYLVSMPFLNYGGPIGSDAARTRLATEAVEHAREASVDLLELRGRGTPPDPALTPSDRKVTVILDLPDDPEVLWREGLRAKVRSQVRRPQKEGMVARFGPDEVRPFYDVFASNMRDLGTPVLPLDFFRRMQVAFPEEILFGCVYLGEEAVAAGCGFVWKGEFEMTWASSLRSHARAAPNMLLYWAFMERMIESGVGTFNFGRCTPGGGTHRFKLQWGGRDEPLPWGQWSPRGVAATPNPDRPLFRIATRIWQRLPLALANRLGPPLARRIP